MCGRYTLIKTDDLLDRYHLQDQPEELAPSYNVAPGQVMPVIIDAGGRNQLQMMKWGLVPSWAKDPRVGYKMINARSEGIENKPSFRHAFKAQRCLVPASGFYEWQKADSDKIPYYITLADQKLISFAGLWEHWPQPDGQTLHSYTIITAPASPAMDPIHDRMPVVLKPQHEDDWLNPHNQDPEFLRQLWQSIPDGELSLVQVSREVNKVSNNNPGLINSA